MQDRWNIGCTAYKSSLASFVACQKTEIKNKLCANVRERRYVFQCMKNYAGKNNFGGNLYTESIQHPGKMQKGTTFMKFNRNGFIILLQFH